MSPHQDKRLATLSARAALAGVTLRVLEGDNQPTYIVTRWHLTRQLETIDAVEVWLDLLTGVAP